MHPDVADALSEVLSGFHLLDTMMTRLGRCSAGTDISEAHDLLTTAWVAVRKIKLQHPVPESEPVEDDVFDPVKPEPATVSSAPSADPFTSW